MRRKRFPDLRKIRLARRKAGEPETTVEAYAAKLGIDMGQLSRIERGLIGRLEVGAALRIAELYGVPVESLVRESA